MSYKNIIGHINNAFKGKILTNESECIVIEELRQIRDKLENKEGNDKLLEKINNCIQDIIAFKKIECIFNKGIVEFNLFLKLFDTNEEVLKRELEAGFKIEQLKIEIKKICNIENMSFYGSNLEREMSMIGKVDKFVNNLNVSNDMLLIQQAFEDLMNEGFINNTLGSIYRKTQEKYCNQIEVENVKTNPESLFLNLEVRRFIDKSNANASRQELINKLEENKLSSDVELLINNFSYVDEKNEYLNSKTIYQLFSNAINKDNFSRIIREKGSDVVNRLQEESNAGLNVEDLEKRLDIIDKIIEDCVEKKIHLYNNNKIKRP